MILSMYGISSKSTILKIVRFKRLTSKYNYTPTIFVTGDLIKKNRKQFKALFAKGVQLGLHGYHHIDHAQLPKKYQLKYFRKAIREFKHNELVLSGFRSPYLRFNKETEISVYDAGLQWTSNTVIFYCDEKKLNKYKKYYNISQLINNFYTKAENEYRKAIPHFKGKLLEIPVTLPDDEILIDRKRIFDSDILSKIWINMIEKSYKQEELINLVFHPERFDIYSNPLENILLFATKKKDIWLAPLDHIAKWWIEKEKIIPYFKSISNTTKKICLEGSERITIHLNHPDGTKSILKDKDSEGNYIVKTKKIPAIHTPTNNEKRSACVKWLKNEGFLLINNFNPDDCAISLDKIDDGHGQISPTEIKEKLKQAKGPILQYSRWPNNYKSALAITMDLDGLNLLDFIKRIYYFYSTNSVNK